MLKIKIQLLVRYGLQVLLHAWVCAERLSLTTKLLNYPAIAKVVEIAFNNITTKIYKQ